MAPARKPGGDRVPEVPRAAVEEPVKEISFPELNAALDRLDAGDLPEPPPSGLQGRNLVATGGKAPDQPASGTETTKPWSPIRDPETGRPMATYKLPKREKADSAELEAIKARFQVQSAASRAVQAAEAAYDVKRARIREFADYDKAGQPHGPLTPEQVRELKALQAWERKGEEAERLDKARRALSAGDYNAVQSTLGR